MFQIILPVIFIFASSFKYSNAVRILIINRDNQVFFDEFSIHQTVLSLKEQITHQVGLCAQDIQILDMYRNAQQDADGFGEYLDWRKLSDFGIRESTTGKILYALRRVVVNDLIVPTPRFATIEFGHSAAFKQRLNGDQTVDEFRQQFGFFVSYQGDLHNLILLDWYDNAAIDADGGIPLDNQPLSRYGLDDQHTGVVVEFDEVVPNNFHGSLTIYYGESQLQFNIEFNENWTVWQLKVHLSSLTGVPAETMLPLDYSTNPAQDADGGVWRDHKRIIEYGLRNYEEFDLCVTTQATSSVPAPPAAYLPVRIPIPAPIVY